MKFMKRDKMCLSKQRYSNTIEAFLSISRIKFKYKNAACTDLRYYFCTNCRGWHLTKKPLNDPHIQKLKWMSGQNLNVSS